MCGSWNGLSVATRRKRYASISSTTTMARMTFFAWSSRADGRRRRDLSGSAAIPATGSASPLRAPPRAMLPISSGGASFDGPRRKRYTGGRPPDIGPSAQTADRTPPGQGDASPGPPRRMPSLRPADMVPRWPARSSRRSSDGGQRCHRRAAPGAPEGGRVPSVEAAASRDACPASTADDLRLRARRPGPVARPVPGTGGVLRAGRTASPRRANRRSICGRKGSRP